VFAVVSRAAARVAAYTARTATSRPTSSRMRSKCDVRNAKSVITRPVKYRSSGCQRSCTPTWGRLGGIDDQASVEPFVERTRVI